MPEGIGHQALTNPVSIGKEAQFPNALWHTAGYFKITGESVAIFVPNAEAKSGLKQPTHQTLPDKHFRSFPSGEGSSEVRKIFANKAMIFSYQFVKDLAITLPQPANQDALSQHRGVYGEQRRIHLIFHRFIPAFTRRQSTDFSLIGARIFADLTAFCPKLRLWGSRISQKFAQVSYLMQAHRIPFLWIFLAVLGGILMEPYFFRFHPGFQVAPFLFPGILILLLGSLLLLPGWNTLQRVLQATALGLLVAGTVMVRIDQLDPQRDPDFIGKSEHLTHFQGKLLAAKALSKGGMRYVLELQHAAKSEGKSHRSRGKLLLYLMEADRFSFRLGSVIRGETGGLQPVPPAPNPGAFDQAYFWSGKGVFHRAFGRFSNWQEIQAPGSSSLLREKIQHKISESLSKALVDSESRGLLEALLLGEKSGLTPELVTDFKRTGAMHILAVSGLHVSILGSILQVVLGLIPLRRRQHLAAGTLILFFVFFAWLTHMEPAIVRAAGSAVFVQAAILLRKTSNPWNNLLAMATLLLLVNPSNLYHIGFQLSFAAVAGILAFYNSGVNCLPVAQPVLRYFWEMTVMGLVAQWMTLPLILYHFHQFSWIFLLSGWIAIPLSTFLLALTLVYLPLAFLPYCGLGTGYLLNLTTCIFRWTMSLLSGISWAVSEGIHLLLPAVLLLALFVVVGGLALTMNRWRIALAACCLMATLFQLTAAGWHPRVAPAILLADRENPLLILRRQKRVTVYSRYPLERQRPEIQFASQWADSPEFRLIPDVLGYVPLGRDTLVLLGGTNREAFKPFGTHWWLLQPVRGDWKTWLRNAPPRVLILDSGLPRYLTTSLVYLGESAGISVHDMRRSGAFPFPNPSP